MARFRFDKDYIDAVSRMDRSPEDRLREDQIERDLQRRRGSSENGSNFFSNISKLLTPGTGQFFKPETDDRPTPFERGEFRGGRTAEGESLAQEKREAFRQDIKDKLAKGGAPDLSGFKLSKEQADIVGESIEDIFSRLGNREMIDAQIRTSPFLRNDLIGLASKGTGSPRLAQKSGSLSLVEDIRKERERNRELLNRIRSSEVGSMKRRREQAESERK